MLQENRFVPGARLHKRRFAPRLPRDGILRVLQEVGRFLAGEGVRHEGWRQGRAAKAQKQTPEFAPRSRVLSASPHPRLRRNHPACPRKRILVTGGTGKAVRHWIVRHLVEKGYDVINVDSRRPAVCAVPDYRRRSHAAGTGGRRVFAPRHDQPHALRRRDPPGRDSCGRTNSRTTRFFASTPSAPMLTSSRPAACSASRKPSSRRAEFVLTASASANQFFEPHYLPIDEAHPQLPEDTYGLTKVVERSHRGDVSPARVARRSSRCASATSSVPRDHRRIKARFNRPEDRLRILWSYIDSRDLAIACRLRHRARRTRLRECHHRRGRHLVEHSPRKQLIETRFLPGSEKVQPTDDRPQRRLHLERLASKGKLLGWKQQFFLQGRRRARQSKPARRYWPSTQAKINRATDRATLSTINLRRRSGAQVCPT